MSRSFLIAQLSDSHVLPRGELLSDHVDTGARLERAVARVNALDPRPQIAVLSGDLVNSGSREEYAVLREILTPLTIPFYLMPGNHDLPDRMRESFPEHAYLNQNGQYVNYVIEDFPVRIIVLDTHVAGRDGGLLDSLRLNWLETRLSEAPQRPTIVFMHHPPFQTGIEGMDEINCGGAGELEKIIRKNPQVERIACGHVHRPIQTRWAGTAACIAPSTAHQIALDLRENEELRYVIEPSGFLLHAWRPEMGLVTHTVWVDDFPGPYSFS